MALNCNLALLDYRDFLEFSPCVLEEIKLKTFDLKNKQLCIVEQNKDLWD